MLPPIDKIKGIHPGLILKREINRNNIKSSEIANTLKIHKQTISNIINQRRGINPEISIKLAEFFNVEKDYFMLLQASYEVEIERKKIDINNTPDLHKIRAGLFWDTSFDKIDWNKNKRAVIQRILERGNKEEILEIINFYGKETVKETLNFINKNYTSRFHKKLKQYDFYQLI
ncbi:HigA family addiction module antitoxin [Tenacibaculum sp. TC6]|uniref:HigA family addiction module antitoxin n=1 Tax=Tenacibaculum sp. TC6 TaxID=3423223 RepID=UPI003D35CB71